MFIGFNSRKFLQAPPLCFHKKQKTSFDHVLLNPGHMSAVKYLKWNLLLPVSISGRRPVTSDCTERACLRVENPDQRNPLALLRVWRNFNKQGHRWWNEADTHSVTSQVKIMIKNKLIERPLCWFLVLCYLSLLWGLFDFGKKFI